MTELYVSARFGNGSHLSIFPDERNGDLWEFRPAPMGYIEVLKHHRDGTVTSYDPILEDIGSMHDAVRADDR